MTIRFINKSNNPLPKYESAQAAGMDIRCFLSEPVTLQPLERKLLPTGLYLELPEGYEAQIRPRSGLALKRGLTVLNSPGTIDADYRGEITIRKRLPETPPPPPQRGGDCIIGYYSYKGFSTRVLIVLGNFVVGIVREKYLLGVAATASKTARGGNIHPEVGITRQTDKERLHLIVVLYQVELFSIDSQVASCYIRIFCCVHCYILFSVLCR